MEVGTEPDPGVPSSIAGSAAGWAATSRLARVTDRDPQTYLGVTFEIINSTRGIKPLKEETS